MSKHFGVGRYAALRIADAAILIVATGTAPNSTTTVTLEQLPWRIFPSRFGLFFDDAPITLPVTRPFVVTGVFAYPKDVASVTIVDALGHHQIPIAADIDMAKMEERSDSAEYLVYRRLDSTSCLIAPSDQAVPAIYTRAFGPAPLAACEAWSSNNCGK